MLISNRCIGCLMPNLIKKSWTVSSLNTSQVQYLHKMPWQWWHQQSGRMQVYCFACLFMHSIGMREKPSKVFGVNGALQVRKATPRVVVQRVHNREEGLSLLFVEISCNKNQAKYPISPLLSPHICEDLPFKVKMD